MGSVYVTEVTINCEKNIHGDVLHLAFATKYIDDKNK